MDQIWPQIESYLTVWWGVPALIWVLAATEGVKRLGVVPCHVAWLVSVAFGIAGGLLWATYGEGNGVANEVAYGVRAAFLAAGLFSAAKSSLEQIRNSNGGGHDPRHHRSQDRPPGGSRGSALDRRRRTLRPPGS